jgi:tetratricopeptide (TPR) repeat protein
MKEKPTDAARSPSRSRATVAGRQRKEARKIADGRVRQQLGRVLASASFQKVERLKRFLSFIVLETVAGRGAQLKEYVVGTSVFGKDASFDPRNDPIVRVQARRLRARLDQYFREEGRSDDVVIDMPKGAYVPSFRARVTEVAPEAASDGLASGTICVMTYRDHSPGSSLAHFCGGVRHEILHRLTQATSLRVIARDPGAISGERDPLEMARSLGAGLAITGAVLPMGGGIRVTTQLVDTATGCYRWSDAMDLAVAASAEVIVADAVAVRLQGESTRTANAPALGTSRENLAARNLYRQGRYHLDQRSEESLRKAADFFHKALAEDPQDALALSGLADAYGLLTHYGVLSPNDAAPRATASASDAVMLDGSSVEARTSLAHVKSTQGWDWRGSEQEFQRAIALDAKYPTAHHWYAMSCLAPMGRLDEALEQIRQAQSLDPVSAIISRDHAMVRCYRREFDAALEACDHTVELNSHFAAGYWALGLVQERRGDLEESIAALQRAVLLSPNSPKMNGALGRALAIDGQRKKARAMLKTLRALARDRYVSPFEFALVFLALGETDEGFVWLDRAVADRSFDLIAINVDPRFDAFRQDRRVATIAKRLGLS